MSTFFIILAAVVTWILFRFLPRGRSFDWRTWFAAVWGGLLGYWFSVMFQSFMMPIIMPLHVPPQLFRLFCIIMGVIITIPTMRIKLEELFPRQKENPHDEDLRRGPTHRAR